MCYVGDEMTCNVLHLAQNLGFRIIPFGGGIDTRQETIYTYTYVRTYIHACIHPYIHMAEMSYLYGPLPYLKLLAGTGGGLGLRFCGRSAALEDLWGGARLRDAPAAHPPPGAQRFKGAMRLPWQDLMAKLGHLLVVGAGLSAADAILHALQTHDVSVTHVLLGTAQHRDLLYMKIFLYIYLYLYHFIIYHNHYTIYIYT